MTAREIKFSSDTAMAEVRLGVTVRSLYAQLGFHSRVQVTPLRSSPVP